MKKIYLLLLSFTFLSSPFLLAQNEGDYIPLGQELNGVASDNFGNKVASSSDGTIIAASGPTESLRGEVKIYELSGTNWVQRGATLAGEANSDNFGNGLSISADGNIIAVGAPSNQAGLGDNSGRVYVYEWNGSSYTQIASLDASASGESFGGALSISANGDVLAVAASFAAGGGTGRGAVRVYERTGDDYLQIGNDINGVQENELFGNDLNIAVTETDTVLAVGAPFFSAVPENFDESGQVRVFNYDGASWSQSGTITGDLYALLGNSLSLSDEGDILAVGTFLSFISPINTYVEVYENTTSWQLLGNRITTSTTYDEFSRGLSLSGDGTKLIVGAPGFVDPESPNGYVNIYKYATSDWNLLDSIAGEASGDIFGTSVAANTTGDQFVVGAPLNNTGGTTAGQVKSYEVFVPDVTNPTVSLSTDENELTNANPFSVTITFNEEITGFEASNITVVNGSASNLLSDDNIVYTADISPAQDGELSVEILSGTTTDLAGNENDASNKITLNYDGTAPTVTLETASNSTLGEPVELTIFFSEGVTGFNSDKISISNGVASNFESINSQNYKVDISPDAELERGSFIKVNVPTAVVKDMAGNDNEASEDVEIEYSIKYSGGSGTEADPYLIGNESDLRSINTFTEDFNSNFEQIADIKVSEESFTPIGNSTNVFSGYYDGKGYNIIGLSNINNVKIRFGGYTGIGLFGDLEGAAIKNLGVNALNINTSSSLNFVGGLAVYAGTSIIENCFVTGSIKTNIPLSNIGGMIGKSKKSSIKSSFTDLYMEEYNPYAMGGLIGSAEDQTTIENSYSVSNLTIFAPSQTDVIDNIYGGLIGEVINAQNPIVITNSYFAGEINTETIDIGGIVAKIKSGSVTINNSFWDIETTGLNKTAGGGTGLTSAEMKTLSTYTNASWNISSDINDLSKIWITSFISYPILSWQLENIAPFDFSGKVINEDGEPFSDGEIVAASFDGNTTLQLDANGAFSFKELPGNLYFINVSPANPNEYFKTFNGDTKFGFRSKLVFYNNSDVTIQMIAKSQENLLDGNGRVSGNVVRANGTTRMVAGTKLDGEPISGVSINLIRTTDDELITTVVTNENGEYEITGIPAGEYQLALAIPGIDLNLEGSTFTMFEEGTPLVISAAVSEDGVVFNIEEEILGIENEIEVAVYPNPVQDFVNIQIPGKAVARIIDINGTVLKEQKFTDQLKLNPTWLYPILI